MSSPSATKLLGNPGKLCLQFSLSSSISSCKTTRGTISTNRCEEKLLNWIFHVTNRNFFCSLGFCCCLSFCCSLLSSSFFRGCLLCSSLFCSCLFCSCLLCSSLFCSSLLCSSLFCSCLF